MKKLLSFLAAASIVLAIILVVARPSTAHAQPGGSIASLCQELGYPQGDCVKRLATLGPAMICGLDDHGAERWIFLGYKSKGECVSYFQQYIRDAVKDAAP